MSCVVLRWACRRCRAHAADLAAGKEKAELCAGCHGENGISQTENIPSLAGQPDQFIQWQLVFFRGGARKNELMQPIVEQINNEDIRNLGAYFASLTPPKAAQARRQSRSVEERRAGGRGAALRLVPRRYICGNQGRRPHRRPARGISGQGAARLQIGRAIRRRRGGDGRCRLSAERGGDHRARALSRASVATDWPARSCRPCKSTFGCHPSSRRSLDESAVICRTSPNLYWPVTTGFGPLSASANCSAISPMVRGLPEPTLKASNPGRSLLARGHGRGGDIPHVDEIPSLPAIFEHPRCFATTKRGCEDRCYAGVRRVTGHAGTINIVITQGRDRSSGGTCPILCIILLCQFAGRIGIARVQGGAFVDQSGVQPSSAARAGRFEISGSQSAVSTRGPGLTSPCSGQRPIPSP